MTAIEVQADAALLADYAADRSSKAFEKLVVRYVDLVHSAAMRQVRDSHLADDVTQAVFLIFSDRASSLPSDTPLAGWFLLTTRHVARNALKREWRLKRRERKAAAMHVEQDNSTSPEARLILPQLDEALTRLNQIDRDAILLRFFYAKSLREVGEALGLSEEAATKRVARALAKLRDLLERSGVTVADATLSATLPMLAAKSATPSLVSAIVSGTSSPNVAALAKPASAISMKMSLVATALAVVVAVVTISQLNRAKPQAAATQPATMPATAPAANPNTISIVAVDSATKQPIAGADVRVQINNNKSAGKTGADGLYSIGVPPKVTDQNITVRVSLAGRVPMRIELFGYNFTGHAPPVFTFPLEPGTTIGGTVCDAAGNPVEGVKVALWFQHAEEYETPQPDMDSENIVTDADGHWKITDAPSELGNVQLHVSSPNFPGSENESSEIVKLDDLRKLTQVSVIKGSDKSVDGMVVDPDGKPVAGATVVVAEDRYESKKATATTDAQGHFQVTGIAKWQRVVTVTAHGFAPQLVEIQQEPKSQTLQIKLDKPNKLEGVVTTPDGKAVAKANVEIESWRNYRALTWKTKTDNAGHFVWNEAPADEVQLNVYGKNQANISGFRATAGGEPVKITIYPPVVISGTVVDADTKQPLPQFKITYGIHWPGQEDVTWQQMYTRTLTDGKYESKLSDLSNGGKLLIEADGYLPQESRMITASEGKITIDFEMKKGQGPHGTIVDAAGKPIANLKVYCLPAAYGGLELDDEYLASRYQSLHTTTDSDGNFKFNPQQQKMCIIAFSDQGVAIVNDDDLAKSGQVKLQPWGKIEGVCLVNTKHAAGAKIYATENVNGMSISGDINKPSIADAQGHFTIDHLAASNVSLSMITQVTTNSWHSRSFGDFQLSAGQMLTVQLGGVGRPVIGQVVLPPGLPDKLDLTQSLHFFTQPQEAIDYQEPLPDNFLDMTPQQREEWQQKYFQSDDYKAYTKKVTAKSCEFTASADGTIRADDVPPGVYRLHVTLQQQDNPAEPNHRRDFGEMIVNFTIPDLPKPPSEEPIDLGKIALKPLTPLENGKPFPSLNLVTLDGKPFKLEELRGKTVVLHIFGMDDTAFSAQLKRLNEQYKDKIAIVEIGLMQPKWVSRFAQKENLPGTLTVDAAAFSSSDYTAMFSSLSIQAVPYIFIINPDGTLQNSTAKPAQLDSQMPKPQ